MKTAQTPILNYCTIGHEAFEAIVKAHMYKNICKSTEMDAIFDRDEFDKNGGNKWVSKALNEAKARFSCRGAFDREKFNRYIKRELVRLSLAHKKGAKN